MPRAKTKTTTRGIVAGRRQQRLGGPTTQRHIRLLNRMEAEPWRVLEDRRCHKPEFCLAFIERCDQRALEASHDAIEHGRAAVALAEKIGQSHLLNLARGALMHALIDARDHEAAERLSEDYLEDASACCAECSSDWRRRLADLMVESRRPGRALELIGQAMANRDPALDPDTRARFFFIRGIAHHLKGHQEAALDDMVTTLLELDLDSPRGYFTDSLAFIACILDRDRSLDERALDDLERFIERLKNEKRGWKDVRLRYRWVGGLIDGRLGNFRRAIERLDNVRRELVDQGPAHHAVAATIDLCQVLARSGDVTRFHPVAREIKICLHRMPSKKTQGGGWRHLEPALRQGLERILAGLRTHSKRTLVELVKLRRSFVAVIPGILGPVLLDEGRE